jgi:hypothetical protein
MVKTICPNLGSCQSHVQFVTGPPPRTGMSGHTANLVTSLPFWDVFGGMDLPGDIYSGATRRPHIIMTHNNPTPDQSHVHHSQNL